MCNILSVDHVHVTMLFFSPFNSATIEGKMFQSKLASNLANVKRKKKPYILLIDALKKSNQFI